MSNKTNPMDVRTDFDRYKERHQKTPTEPIHSTSLKTIIIGACVLVVAALIVIPIIISATRARHLARPEKINKITIYKEGTAGTTFSYTDSEKIGKLTDYLTSLKLKLANETNASLIAGVVTIPMLFMFFVFAGFLYSQLKTGNSSNYFIYTRGIRRFRRVAIVYAIITTLTVIAQLIIIFTSELPSAPQIVIFIGIGLSAAWLIVILECTRKISFYL